MNLHDPALAFEAIHRVVFEVAAGRSIAQALEAQYPGRVRVQTASSFAEVKALVDAQTGAPHKIGLCTAEGFAVLEVAAPNQNLPVGSLQTALDAFMKDKGARELDYVHGDEPVISLGQKHGNGVPALCTGTDVTGRVTAGHVDAP